MNIKLLPGFTVGVWNQKAGEWADMRGTSGLLATVLRPDESLVEREAKVTDDPKRIEVAWHPEDMDIPGIYVGEVSGVSPEGSRFTLSKAFRLYVGGADGT